MHSSHAQAKDQIEILKGEVRKMLIHAVDKSSQKLNLIDQIQRLGIAYHFEIEIDQLFEKIHRSYFEFHYGNDDNLHTAIHKGMPRLEARRYIPLYQEDPSHNEVLLSLAKLDFNLLQEQHQKELGNLTRWWMDLDVETKLPFARDRLVEMYLWMSGVYFEPKYGVGREMLTKVAIMVSIIDDIYDVYGTLEELELFKEAVERWDIDAKDGLPEYLQACYKIILDLYDEIGYEMKNQVRAYFAEAKWFHQNRVSTMEEYMPIALATSALEVLPVTSLLGMGDIVTKDVFDWLLDSDPKMAKAVKFEQERGHGPTSVECFVNNLELPRKRLRRSSVTGGRRVEGH
uniref:Terpene synthase n=1 Tax=Psidium guajava TaxID=120290 RepID=A0AA95ZAA2_PSIGU|nr:terpene synthase [Psidium guajava]